MSDNIPFEIQLDIIKRIPDVKSIIRYRSVSKPWKSFIDTSEFIAGYRARKTQPRSLLLRYKDNSNEAKFLSVHNETFEIQQDLAPNVSVLMKQKSDIVIIGSSRGLLCFYDKGVRRMLLLWNPSVRRCVGVLGAELSGVFGFAVCPVTNEPTIVKISFPWKVHIFALSSKKWTQIQCREAFESVTLRYTQVVIGSYIYRVASKKNRDPNGYISYEYMIVSFDLIAKEFRAINIPDEIIGAMCLPMSSIISKLKGSLVVTVPSDGVVVKVWKMEPDCSFTQLFTICDTPDSYICDIVGFRKNGHALIETETWRPELTYSERDSALKVYNPCSNDLNNLGFSGQRSSFFISSYKETLHLLDHLDSCVYL